VRPAALALAACLGAAPAGAAGPDLHGYVKLQSSLQLFRADDLGGLLAGTRVHDFTLDMRLDTVWRRSRWDFALDTQLVGIGGDGVAARTSPLGGELAALLFPGPVPRYGHEWLDLSHIFSSTSSRLVFARFDRFSVGWTGDRFVARLGRQALSWGGGLVFQVFDLFNPFPPTVIDTDYKPGTDMLSTQWLLAGGDDLQAIVVPRRSAPSRPVTADQSSLAAKWHHFAGSTEIELLAAEHVDDAIAGVGASGNLAGGVWRVNATYTALTKGGGVTSLVANLDHSWVWSGKNAYGFVEVFRNGFGVTNLDRDLATLPAPLSERLDRGELFNLGRDELAAGLQLQWTPLLELEPTVLVNLDDDSSMLLVRVNYDWRENLTIDGGLQVGFGPRGTEYGGVPIGNPTAWAASGRLLWIRLARYF
jgi:hypothetical protein